MSCMYSPSSLRGLPLSRKNVIPQSCKSELLIGPYGFLQAVERVSILAGGNIIRLTAASGKLVLLSGTADIGEVRDEISLEAMEGMTSPSR